MTEEELKALDKEVKKLKRISSEWASQLHDSGRGKIAGRIQGDSRYRAIHIRRVPGMGGGERKTDCSTERDTSSDRGIDMSNITGITRGGTPYEPTFITALNAANCLGCGRCFKVCPRKVFELVERSEDDENYDEDEDNCMVMTLANALDCIGCGSCARVCPKQCQTHSTMPVGA